MSLLRYFLGVRDGIGTTDAERGFSSVYVHSKLEFFSEEQGDALPRIALSDLAKLSPSRSTEMQPARASGWCT